MLNDANAKSKDGGCFSGVGETSWDRDALLDRVVELMRVVKENTPLAHQVS